MPRGHVDRLKGSLPTCPPGSTTTSDSDCWVPHETTRGPRGHSRVERRAANGKIAQITNAKGQTTSYRSSPFGQLVRLTDPLGNTIDVTYDRLGRKKELRDPDLGTWQYRVDALGQTYWQQDAKGQVTAFTHDELGRLTRQLEPDADSYWVYDSAANGIGKLDETYTLSGTGSKDFRRVHTYDALSRPARVVTSLDWDYAQEFTYDDYQRISTVSHRRSARGGTTGPVNTFTYDYNTFGFEERIGRLMSDGSKRSMLYTSSRDAQGRLTVGFLGVGVNHWRGYNDHTGRIQEISTGVQWNDLVPGRTGDRNGARNGLLEYIQTDTYYYDGVGNLEQRTQLSDGPGTEFSDVYETFTYDELDRLQSATVHNYNATTDYNYDAIGNLSVNAGKLYTYPPSGAGSVRPHAVSSITGTVGGVVDPVFTYDDNGNLLSGVNRSYAWTASNHAKHIDRWSAGAAVQRTEFVLGSAKERVQQTVRAISGGVPGAAQRVIYYAGAIEKEIDFQAGKTRIRTYMPQGLGFVQEELEGTAVTPDSAIAVDSRQERLYLRDHLGSVSGVFDGETGVSLQFLRYDPWGRRRNADGTEDADPELGALRNEHDRRGFTGQEHLEELGLVHLNGRIYDPITARMVSADPTVPDAYDLQAVNRYAYVLNNPLAYTDPTGFEPGPPCGTANTACVTGTKLPPGLSKEGVAGFHFGLGSDSSGVLTLRFSQPGTRFITVVRITHKEALLLLRGVGSSAAASSLIAVSPIAGVIWATANHPNNGSPEADADALNVAPGTSGADSSSPEIHEGQQGKHVPGHNNFQPGKSELTDPDPQGLLDQGAGTGQQVGSTPLGQAGSKERVDFGRNIGVYVDPVTGERSPTSVGIIHHGSRGSHIVPARPRQ